MSHSFLTDWPDGTDYAVDVGHLGDAGLRINSGVPVGHAALIYGTKGLARPQLTATAATNGIPQRSAVHANTGTFNGDLGVRPA